MLRSSLSVTPLEDRTTPVTFTFSTKLMMLSVSTPPQDPMDNPPPAQPGGGGSTGGTGSTSPPTPPTPPTPVVITRTR